jgi:hypothetical protein
MLSKTMKPMKPMTEATSRAISLEDAVDAVASAIAMSVTAQHGSETERAEAVAWLKGWFSDKRVFLDSKHWVLAMRFVPCSAAF